MKRFGKQVIGIRGKQTGTSPRHVIAASETITDSLEFV